MLIFGVIPFTKLQNDTYKQWKIMKNEMFKMVVVAAFFWHARIMGKV